MKFEKNCPFYGGSNIDLSFKNFAECWDCGANAPWRVWENRSEGESCYLVDYVKREFNGNGTSFAKSIGVTRQQIQPWLTKNYVVVDGSLYSWRRYMSKPGKTK